jgi:hypothetical protein
MPKQYLRVAYFVVSLLGLAGITLVGVRYIESGGLSGLGYTDDTHPATSHFGPWAAIAVLTAGGVVASVLVAALKAMPQDRPVEPRSLLAPLLYPQTFIALCLSPLVFFTVAASIDIHKLGIAAYLSAFQNGFFWKQIIAGRDKQQSTNVA